MLRERLFAGRVWGQTCSDTHRALQTLCPWCGQLPLGRGQLAIPVGSPETHPCVGAGVPLPCPRLIPGVHSQQHDVSRHPPRWGQ